MVTNASRATAAQFAGAESLDQLYQLLKTIGVGPGWNKPEPAIWPSPRKNFLPAHFSYNVCRAALDAAGAFVSTEFAERRNLILANPVPGNTYATARTIIAAYQMVKGAEAARSHRHTPNALRLAVDSGPKVFTVVDGRKIPMEPGDVLLTPSWSWHGHSNDSAEHAYWIDFLDAPLVQLLEPMFLEPFAEGFVQQTDTIDPGSPYRYAFSDTRKRLENTAETQPGLRDVLLGPKRLDTLDLHVWRLDAARHSVDKRSTANSVFAVIEGRGTSAVGEQEFHWERGDVFVVPAWTPHTCSAVTQSFLLRVTDEPVMKCFNWLRQD